MSVSAEFSGPQGEADLRRLAARRVAVRRDLLSHLMIYLVVNGGLLGLNILTSPGHWWVIWPIFGWGIGLGAHVLSVISWLSGDEERAIEAEMARLRLRRHG